MMLLFDPMADTDPGVRAITGSIKLKDLLLHYARDISLRWLNDDPTSVGKATMKRDSISPTLYLFARSQF